MQSIATLEWTNENLEPTFSTLTTSQKSYITKDQILGLEKALEEMAYFPTSLASKKILVESFQNFLNTGNTQIPLKTIDEQLKDFSNYYKNGELSGLAHLLNSPNLMKSHTIDVGENGKFILNLRIADPIALNKIAKNINYVSKGRPVGIIPVDVPFKLSLVKIRKGRRALVIYSKSKEVARITIRHVTPETPSRGRSYKLKDPVDWAQTINDLRIFVESGKSNEYTQILPPTVDFIQKQFDGYSPLVQLFAYLERLNVFLTIQMKYRNKTSLATEALSEIWKWDHKIQNEPGFWITQPEEFLKMRARLNLAYKTIF